jgi:cytochrome c nitrite reductase small subunit
MAPVIYKIRESLRRPRTHFILGSILVAMLFITAAGISVTSNPRFCIVCHDMQPEYNAWKKSSHSQITCYACHVKPGLVNLIEDKVFVGLPTVVSEITNNYHSPINKGSKVSVEMSNESCLVCHDEIKRKITPSAGLKMNHKPHLQRGIKCTVCHNRVAHRDVKNYEGEQKVKIDPVINDVFKGVLQPKEPDYPDHIKMRYCRRCHTNPENRDKELMAHYPQLKDLDIPTSCTTCHPNNFNFKPPSHWVAGYFPYQLPGGKRNSWHSKGAKIDKKYCLSCHDEKKLCYGCHKLWPMPHPKDWAGGKNLHPKYGKNHKEICMRCHGGIYFCNECHHGVTGYQAKYWFSKLPGKTQHKFIVKERGAAYCFRRCHQPTFCAKCHVTGSPY